MLVSINSIIIDEVIHFQNLTKDYDLYTVGEKQYKKLSFYYYDQGTRIYELKDYLESNM